MKFYFITNSSKIAKYAVNNGVDRIFVDLELLGKSERQGHLDTVISHHTFADLAAVRSAIPDAELMVRLNPINPDTEAEVQAAIQIGANILMLPMFRSLQDVQKFSSFVDRRARICLLVETIGAMDTLQDSICVPGVSEVHIGLNDLHLELKQDFMFEPLACGYVDQMAKILCQAGIPFGIGGIARIGEGMLPAELILSEHVRLGSTAAILSRSFHKNASTIEELAASISLSTEIQQLRDTYADHQRKSLDDLERTRLQVNNIIANIKTNIRAKAVS